MRKPKNIVGLAAIDKAIKGIAGVAGNLNERIQDVAVAIIEHAAGAGNGDMSRALTLCKTVSRYKTLNVAYLIGYFRYFGNANVNLRANDGAGKVSLIARDSKAYRGGFDTVGAKANNWNDAFKEDGSRSDWYEGPRPAEFQPATIGDLAEDLRRAVKRERDKLEGTKEIGGKVVPLVRLTDADKTAFENALEMIERMAATLARHEDVQKAIEAQKVAEAAVEADEEVVEILRKPAKAA